MKRATKRTPKPRKESALEALFAAHLRNHAPDLCGYEREVEFAKPRKFRADFCWQQARVIVELDGGVYSGGRHVRGKGCEEDLVKLNLAVLGGWRVLRFSSGMVESDPLGCIEQVRKLVLNDQ